MKLSDYVVDFLVKEGVKHSFLISGGAVIHLVDSVAAHPDMMVVCTQHEQAAGAAADMYARVTGNIGLAMVTSGPGGTNLITSICNAYFDSIPCVFVCGQVATFRLKPEGGLRQKGFQETDIVSITESITKYARLVRSADDIKYELEKAIYLARSGRPGPVLLDIPDDLQRVDVDPAKLRSFNPAELGSSGDAQDFEAPLSKLHAMIESSLRPVLILGAGVRLAREERRAIEFARKHRIPILLTWGAFDLLPADDDLNMGGLGVVGPRSGNFAAQTSDLVIAIGTRLSQMITGGKQNLFAPGAKKVMVDIDANEIEKFGTATFELDLAICAGLSEFFDAVQSNGDQAGEDRFGSWREQIREWERKYPIVAPEYTEETGAVNAYVFVDELSRQSSEGDIIATDAGGNLSWTMQAIRPKKDQRVFSAWNHSPMGYSMPAAIGAAFAAPAREVICIIGDGGLMMCLEELGTIRRYDLAVKIFVFNNHGHGIQKQTIETWLNSRYVAVDHDTGLYFPDFMKTGALFNMPTFTIDKHADLGRKIREVLMVKGPALCNVEISRDQRIIPMLKFGAGLEDLDPKIPEHELADILSVTNELITSPDK